MRQDPKVKPTFLKIKTNKRKSTKLTNDLRKADKESDSIFNGFCKDLKKKKKKHCP
jgi:hypothetical protein